MKHIPNTYISLPSLLCDQARRARRSAEDTADSAPNPYDVLVRAALGLLIALNLILAFS